jgi:hypothetical protein
VLVVMLVRGATSGEHDASSVTTTVPAASTWAEQAAAAFKPLTRSSQALPATARDWLSGALGDDEFSTKLSVARTDAEQTVRMVAALPANEAKALYLASAQLYLEHVRIHQASLGVAEGPMREQVALLARRVRELSDRVFDRGHAMVDPAFGADQPDVEVNLPEEVPDWEAEGMAAGPPFDDEPGPPATVPPLRAETRPIEPEADWLAAVDAAGAPDALDLEGDVAAQARAYVDAAETLRDEPDPDVDGGRERSAVLRLGYLVKADAARAAQAGLDDIAQELDAIRLAG